MKISPKYNSCSGSFFASVFRKPIIYANKCSIYMKYSHRQVAVVALQQ